MDAVKRFSMESPGRRHFSTFIHKEAVPRPVCLFVAIPRRSQGSFKGHPLGPLTVPDASCAQIVRVSYSSLINRVPPVLPLAVVPCGTAGLLRDAFLSFLHTYMWFRGEWQEMRTTWMLLH